MKEIEKDGFITREEDLMMSERTAKPVTECDYPKCDGCDKYVDGYCTVPMVVSKQIYRFTAERIAHLEKSVIDLEKLVMDEILGEEEGGFRALTEEEYNELSPLQKAWYNKGVRSAEKAIRFGQMMSAIPKGDGKTVVIRAYAPINTEEVDV